MLPCAPGRVCWGGSTEGGMGSCCCPFRSVGFSVPWGCFQRDWNSSPVLLHGSALGRRGTWTLDSGKGPPARMHASMFSSLVRTHTRACILLTLTHSTGECTHTHTYIVTHTTAIYSNCVEEKTGYSLAKCISRPAVKTQVSQSVIPFWF